MPKINTLHVGILNNNPGFSTYEINSLDDAECTWENLGQGKGKLNISLSIDNIDPNSPIQIELDEIINLKENKGVIVLDKNDSNKIPITLKDNFIKFDTNMSKTQFTLTFTLAGKAGGTTGKAGGTTGKAGGTTEANFLQK